MLARKGAQTLAYALHEFEHVDGDARGTRERRLVKAREREDVVDERPQALRFEVDAPCEFLHVVGIDQSAGYHLGRPGNDLQRRLHLVRDVRGKLATQAVCLLQFLVLSPELLLLLVDAQQERTHLLVGVPGKRVVYVELVERTHDARREETREHDDENHGDNEHDPHGQGHRAEKGRQGEPLLAHAHEVAIGETLGDVYGIPVQGIRMAHQHPLAGMLGGEHLRTFEVVFEGAIPDRGVEDDITGRIDERESLGAGKLMLENPDTRIDGIFLEYLGARPRLFDE